MRTFKDLTISGTEEDIDRLIDRLSSSLPEGWSRDLDAEQRAEELRLSDEDDEYAFTRRKGDVPDAGIYIVRRSGTLTVPNVVPLKSGELSIDEYNRIVDEFVQIVVERKPPELAIKVSSGTWDPRSSVSEEAAELLERFSVLANMSTGSAHPLDFKRWAQFIVRVHSERSELDTHMLTRWLVEQLEWPRERAEKLAGEYEFGRGLLEVRDRCEDSD